MNGRARTAGRAARLRARSVTAPLRALPDFAIIGAQKAGTTSLYAYLSAHPQVLPAARKEVHFFDREYPRGELWYRSMFPLRASLRPRAGARPITGEATPYYLFHPLAAERAAGLLPRARLIVVLRDPVERAWSHYRHEVAAGREALEFAAALDAEAERLAGADLAVRAGDTGPAATRHRAFSYAARGMYADQLATWLACFPRERLLVLFAEDLFGKPERTWRTAVEFLGLTPGRPPAFEVHNPGRQAGMDAASRARLDAVFAEPNRQLAALLGVEPPWARHSE